MNRKKELSSFIKEESQELGFSFSGIIPVTELSDHRPRLVDWLDKGHHADMAWMENNLDKRLNPSRLVEGAKSVVILALSYYQDYAPGPGQPVFARYALGEDYHKIIKDKIYLLLESIRSEAGEVNGRVFVDSAPVLERALAEKAGLGWIGKNSMLINRDAGSWLFIGELISDLELQYDDVSIKDYCGSCSKCVDACPTGAILANRTLDSGKCISYLTIEKKSDLSEAERQALGSRVFGCDICQEVCPWNSKAEQTIEPAFSILPEIRDFNRNDWLKITEDEFNIIFRKSPVLRTGYKGFKRNLNALSF